MSRILKILVIAAIIGIGILAWKATRQSTDVDVEYES